MRVIELRLPESDPVTRGVAYGRATGPDIRDAIERYRAAYREFGVPDSTIDAVVVSCVDAIPVAAPAQWAELQGVAEGADTTIEDLLLLTARTEILAHSTVEAVECSTVVAVHADRRPQTMQTWDWHGDLAPTGVLLEIPLGSRVVRTFTETGMLGKIGVTDGLGIHFNILHHSSDPSVGGIPVHIVMRMILDQASTLDEAIDIARRTPVSASTVLTVIEAASDRGPARAASIELAPAGVAVVAPTRGLLVHTNHFLDEGLAADGAAPYVSTTEQRYAHVDGQRDALMRATDSVSFAAAMCGAAGAGAPICVRAREDAPLIDRWESLITLALDVDAAAIDWVVGPPSGFIPGRVSRFA